MESGPESGMTWGTYYWPCWFAITVMSLLIPEIYALISNVNNTQSYWVWKQLEISPLKTAPWTAVHYLAFGLWLTLMSWLTFHFFFRKFV